MFGRIWKKCANRETAYETVSYIICGIFTTLVDFLAYTALRKLNLGVGVSQALSWVAAVLFAYVVNKLIVFRNYNMGPSYLAKEAGTFVAARAFSGAVTWLLMMVMVQMGGDRGLIYELFCKLTSSVLNLVLNYIFSKLWIFKNKTGGI